MSVRPGTDRVLQSNIPEYDSVLQGNSQMTRETGNFYRSDPNDMSWATPSVSKTHQRTAFRERTSMQPLSRDDSRHESRQPPVAQVMPTPTPQRHRKAEPKNFPAPERSEKNPKVHSSRSRRTEHRHSGLEKHSGESESDGYEKNIGDEKRRLSDRHFNPVSLEETRLLWETIVAEDDGNDYLQRYIKSPPVGRHEQKQSRRDTKSPGKSPKPSKVTNMPKTEMYPTFQHVGLGYEFPKQYTRIPSVYEYPLYGNFPASDNKIHDLTNWQKNVNARREELLRTQLDHLHLSSEQIPPGYNGLPQRLLDTAPSLIHSNYSDPRMLSGGMSNPQSVGLLGTDMGKLEGIIQAKESILSEKNYVIDRQKVEINQLHEKLRGLHADERQLLYGPSRDQADILILKLQEYQYEISTLKSQLAELGSARASEYEQLGKKLGETEYELKRSKEKNGQTQTELQKENNALKKQLSEESALLEESQKNVRRERERHAGLKKKLEGVERYVKTLPTAEEYSKVTQDIESLKEKEKVHKERITDLESLLSQSRNQKRERETEIVNLEANNSELTLQIESLKREMSRLQQALGAPKMDDPASLTLCSKNDLEELKARTHKLREQVEHRKKIAESKHKQMKKMQIQHQKVVQELEERLLQEEDTSTALREEIHNKELEMGNIKTAMKELSVQSQELLSHNINLQEQNKALENELSSERVKGTKKLVKEMKGCLSELQQLLQVCMQRAEGQEPNISMLLGVRSSSSMSVDHSHLDTLDTDGIAQQRDEIQQMRKDIDVLRAHIADKYAEDVGNHCTTQ